jgi:hypothetical protein
MRPFGRIPVLSVPGHLFVLLCTHLCEALVLIVGLCGQDQAKSRKQKCTSTEPESQLIVMQRVIKPSCGDWSQSRTQR